MWADAVLEPGTVIVYAENAKTFNPYWGNSEGVRWFDWWQTKDILEHSVTTWREQYGTSYALVRLTERELLAESQEGKAFLNQLLLLREFGVSEQVRGPALAFYRMWNMDVDLRVQFGDRLEGSGIEPPEPAPISAQTQGDRLGVFRGPGENQVHARRVGFLRDALGLHREVVDHLEKLTGERSRVFLRDAP